MEKTRAHWHELAALLPAFTDDEAIASLGVLADYYQHYQLPNRQVYQHRIGQLEVEQRRIVLQSWSPSEPKGTLCIVHGLFDHTGIYQKIIDYALAANWRVCMFDLPGHGLSSGRRASIKTFDTYVAVLDAAVAAFTSLYGNRLHALGQSTGGGVLMRHCLMASEPHFERVVLISPLLRAKRWNFMIFAHGMLRWWTNRIPRGFSASSHDQAFVDFLAHSDPLQSRYLYLDWLAAMFNAESDFHLAAMSDIDIHMVQGSGDNTVDWRYNIKHIPKKFSRLQLLMIEGAGHQLVNEAPPYITQLFSGLDDIL